MGLIYRNHYNETALLMQRQIRKLVGKFGYHSETTATNLNGIYEEDAKVMHVTNVGCTSVDHLPRSQLPSTDTDIKTSKLNQFFCRGPELWYVSIRQRRK